ncbi:DUF4349 domain-containing protein [Actinomadura latina]|uniref:DUF4349 domain-containing protein n=1 Tax=Actinomadura latina TaxID=163603 RepID=A0A846YW77_9ACTN|nr:DUF4349 domain-containing protein [Actinomadura latina]NKZ04331.1 DUF4349 domain-containing protein [Actinomadura latina]
MRIVRNVTCALVVLLLAGVLAACGGGSSDSSEAVDRGGAPAPATRNEAGPAGGPAAGKAAGGNTADGSTARGPQAPLPAGREVVHTARLRVRAGDVEDAAAKAKQMATSAGGYIEQESSSSEPARSEITLKVPADRYTDVLNQLSTQLGTRLSLSQEAEDVTGEVADVDARVRSAKAALESFRKLLGRANSVGEVIQVEQEIAEREADLEALQARSNSLKHRTQYATVTVTLVTKTAAPKEDDERGGFIGGLQNGWDAFTAFIGGIAAVVGWLLPFLVLAAAIGWPLLAFRRRFRGRRPDPNPNREPEKAAAGAGPSQEPPA